MMMQSDMADAATPKQAAFPVDDLRFALAWSRLAPGIGGWPLAVEQISSGEMIEVIPPGAEYPVFCILPRAGHVQIIRERSIDVGGGQVTVGCVPSLREAVLLLCPLHEDQVSAIEVELSDASSQGLWGLAA